MLENHLQIAIRNLFSSEQYTVINIVGLSKALTCCIVAYLHHLFSFGRNQYSVAVIVD